MIKKILLLGLCVFLTGCSCKVDLREKITFSTWGSASEMAILEPIIADFEKQNPRIKIELMHIPQDYFQKLHLLFASNTAPDVIFINNLNIPTYADKLEDLTPHIKKEEFYEKSIVALSNKDITYAIPRDVSNLVIYYNKSLFKKYGVPYPNKDWSLDDLIIVAQRMTRNGVFGISYEPQIFYAMPFIMAFGGDILNDYLEYVGTGINAEKGVELYKELAFHKHIAPMPSQIGSKTLAQMFLEGKIAMHLSGRWVVPKYRESAKFDWDIINFPDYLVPCDASGWAVSNTSKHKENAIKFVLFLSKKENIEKMTQSGLIVPARIDVAESQTFLSGKPEHAKAFITTIEHSKVTNVNKEYNSLIDKTNDFYFTKK